jgi:hypothetical protein
MKKLRNQNLILFALLVLLAAFAGCKGESPTAPEPSGGGGTPTTPGGGTTPPVGASIVLTATNASPLAASTTTITATVTSNGQPVANGTAVEFATNFGSFSLSDPNLQSIIRTTTNGVATVTLTAPSPGPAVVTAVVNNVSARTTITFQAQQVPPVTPSTSPTITSISPAQGRPAGGEQFTINGTNFRSPARVIFDFGGGVTKDAFVVSVTPTQIVALTPPIDVTTAQQRQATITVIVDAGTTNEQKVTSAANAFTFQSEVLTPSVVTVSPSAGDVTGGTRVTIFGSGFQAPVQVQFSLPSAGVWQDLQVISVNFNQIVALTPAGRDVSGSGNAPVTGPVDLRVVNVNSATNIVLPGAYRYTPGVQITVSGTQIVVIASPASPTGCADITGNVVVTNVDNGDGATGPPFRYRVTAPTIVGVSPTTPTAGGTVNVSVANSFGGTVFQVGDRTLFPTASTTLGGITTYTLTLPTNFPFTTGSCQTSGGLTGTSLQPLSLGLTVTNPATTCTSQLANALSIQPQNTTCNVTPPAAAVTAPASGCASAGNIASAGTTTGTATITIANTAPAGSQPLTISAIAVSNQVNGAYSVSPNAPQTIPAGGSRVFTVTVDPTAAGPTSANVNFTTNDVNNPTLVVCVNGTGT